jgi:hypothetical protein
MLFFLILFVVKIEMGKGKANGTGAARKLRIKRR